MQRLVLLLLLLGVDWYFDTSLLASPFARPFCNTEFVCQSKSEGQANSWEFRPFVLMDADRDAAALDCPHPRLLNSRDASRSYSASDDSIYVFMSIQC
jgi:hypothetical protein